MGENLYEKAIFTSWKNCARLGLCPDIKRPAYSEKESQIKRLQENCLCEIAAFTESVRTIRTVLPERTAFLLTDEQGILLKKIPDIPVFCEFKEGISLAEKHSGTNAIALALRLNESVQTDPQQHYCAFLGTNYLYALPLCLQTRHVCLALITSQREISRELLALTHLLARNVTQELSLICMRQTSSKEPSIRLGKKQWEVLVCMARGMTDKAVSGELGICIDTVKYHKRNLFKLLGVDCGMRAVIVALQKGLISLDELASPTHYTFV